MSTDFFSILKSFNNFSTTDDSQPDIESLNLLPFESATDELDNSKKMILVLVESRLLEPIPDCIYSPADLLKRLYSFKSDLQKEGFQSKFIETKIFADKQHRDGKKLLAIREFFREIKNTYEKFEGAILVGSFPEAMIVRTWLRPETLAFSVPSENASFPAGTLAYHVGACIHGYRSEIVLSNLSGNWENIYHTSDTINYGIFKPDSEQMLPARWTKVTCKRGNYRQDSMSFEDFFWIKDDEWRLDSQTQDSITLIMNSNQLDSTRAAFNQMNSELGTNDRLHSNAIAQPDIIVSRINARHIATNPDSSLLDSNGKPAHADFNDTVSADIFNWKHSAALERKLFIDYFDRNHAFRNGKYSSNETTISNIEYDFGLESVNDGFYGISTSTDEIHNASLLDFVRWLKLPVTIRGIGAHTSGRSSSMTVFRNDNFAQIEIESGGSPWRWIQRDNEFIPSFEGLHTADLNLYRTLYENKVLQNTTPSFFLHTGFDANTPDKADTVPYNSQEYGACQTSEGILFFLNGLSVLSRSRMYAEGPKGFGIGFGSSDEAHLGNGWKEYFQQESQNATLAKNPSDRKKCYSWNILGDWTLRKFYTPAIHYQNNHARSSSGFFKQGNLGKVRGNFELVIPRPGIGLEHYLRNNDDPSLKWYGPTLIDSTNISSCCMIQSTFGDSGNLEVIARCNNHLHYYWREDTWPFNWHKEIVAAFSSYDFSGNPAFIQGNMGGSQGNFELVIPMQNGGLAHLSRDNHSSGFPWTEPVFFGDPDVKISGVALIQNNYGEHGCLEVVAIEKKHGRLVYYWRENSIPYHWFGPFYFGGPGFTGVPSLIQRESSSLPGNLELVAPVKGGGFAHYCKEGNFWNGPVYFGCTEVNAVSMIQSNFGQYGNLELVTIENGKPVLYWRDDTAPFQWHGPEIIQMIHNAPTPKKKKTQKEVQQKIKEPVLA